VFGGTFRDATARERCINGLSSIFGSKPQINADKFFVFHLRSSALIGG
jgi:hypothetical protein